MKLKQNGRYVELPIVGFKINKIQYDGHLTLFFDDVENSYLEFDSSFFVTVHQQTWTLHPREKESLTLFFDHYNISIKEAKADSKGQLWLTFENGTEVTVEDGPFENWLYTKKNSKDCLHVHGGVGRTVY